jgi:hypothetical protein
LAPRCIWTCYKKCLKFKIWNIKKSKTKIRIYVHTSYIHTQNFVENEYFMLHM